jgi:cobyrinic acid a,c-diamide synthase
MPHLFISATHRSSGKTTLSIGLCAAFAARGLTVQAFKKGPDYIDPMWLARATGRACYNLDPRLMRWEEIDALFARHAAGSDLALVEGNQGLYDGLALDGSNSNAALAHRLGAPVVLVVDARGMTRGIAPLLLGYQAFDRAIRIGGVILNRVGGSRHETKLRAVIEHYTDIPVLGAVHLDERISIVERHLGLVPSNEAREAAAQIERIGAAVAAQVDLPRLLDTAREAPAPAVGALGPPRVARGRGRRPRIGVAMDRAFGFYYADDLEALRASGADLVPFDTLRDGSLPPLDGAFIGGGFPESCAAELEANAGMRSQLRAAIEAGLPVYAECGGLMYLARSLTVAGRTYAMVGAIGGDVTMHRRPVGRGYVELEATGAAPWAAAAGGSCLQGHEFHYSRLENLGSEACFAYRVRRGYGIDGENDGIVVQNVLASYSHLRGVGGCHWPQRFVEFVRQVQGTRGAARRPLEGGYRAAGSAAG